MNLPAEQRDFAAAGTLADELPYWGWLNSHPFALTRGGELLAVARLTPAVVDGKTPEALDRILGRWQRLLSGLDPQTRLYFYMLRRPPRLPEPTDLSGVAHLAQKNRRDFLAPRVQALDTYVVWCTDPGLEAAGRAGPSGGPWLFDYVRNWLRARRNPNESVYLRSQIQQAATRFRQLVDASAALADDATPLSLLPPLEASAFLSELINRPGLSWPEQSLTSGLNSRLSLSELEAERRHLRLDSEPVILYSLTAPPVTARANLLEELARLQTTLTVSLEWRPYSLDSARRKIRSVSRHYFSQRYSMLAHAREAEGTANAMVDPAAEAESARLGGALVELEANGVAYGDISLSIALHGDLGDTERLDAELRRIFAGADAQVIREGYAQLPVWFARLPGMPRPRQLRSVFASAGVAACLAPIFGPAHGSPTSAHLSKPCLSTFETRWRTPYFYDLFASDVGHTVILGATGSGKSFLLNSLLVQSLQYRPRILVLDLGGSYRWLTQFLGGNYLQLSPDTADGRIALKPFALPPGERTYQFLTGWITRLLRIAGYDPTGADPSEIRARVEDVYTFDPHARSLASFVQSLPKRMWPAMSRWHGDGAWGAFFDNPTGEEIQLADWQVIDLAGAAEHADLCEAALFFLLERMRLALDNPDETTRLKLMVVDEAWRFLTDPSILNYLSEAAKTWRKRNAALILATQSAADITASPAAHGLLESLPTKLFLANPDLPDTVADLFRLNPTEMATIRQLIPKQEIFLRRAHEAAVLQLRVDPESYWIYTSNPSDAARRARAVADHGLERGLAALARNRT